MKGHVEIYSYSQGSLEHETPCLKLHTTLLASKPVRYGPVYRGTDLYIALNKWYAAKRMIGTRSWDYLIE